MDLGTKEGYRQGLQQGSRQSAGVEFTEPLAADGKRGHDALARRP